MWSQRDYNNNNRYRPSVKELCLFLAGACVGEFVFGRCWREYYASNSLGPVKLSPLRLSSSSSLRGNKFLHNKKIIQEEQPSIITNNNNNNNADAGNHDDHWTETEIVAYMNQHPQRYYFSHLFKLGSYRRGIEIGNGRFSEIILEQNSKFLDNNNNDDQKMTWILVEPPPKQPTKNLIRGANHQNKGKWERRQGYSTSTDPALLDSFPDGYFDFVYVDYYNSHEYNDVMAELIQWWPKVRSGGILAGHDYCHYYFGEQPATAGQSSSSSCKGCEIIRVPQCHQEGGSIESSSSLSSTFSKLARSLWNQNDNNNGVVQGVQDWMMMMMIQQESSSLGDGSSSSLLTLRHTMEDFTRESLAKDGFDVDNLVTTERDRNPSWYIYKP